MLWLLALVIFAAGCLGGLASSAVIGEFRLPYHDRQARVFRPGWIGTMIAGGMAAGASWGVYGPLASQALIGGEGSGVILALTLSEFFGAVLIGVGGGRWLTVELERLLMARQREALEETKKRLVRIAERSLE